jgi:hypothetical protein
MHLVARDELAKVLAQLVVGVGGDVVELVHRDQRLSNASMPKPVHREAEGRMGADQHLVIAFKETAPTLLTLPPSSPGALQRFHFGATVQSAQKAELGQRLIGEAGADAFSGTTMIACFNP